MATTEAEKQRPISLGMRLVDLTEDIVMDVAKMYDHITGSKKAVAHFINAPFEENTLNYINNGPGEWRFGSKISGHSKLYIDKRGRVEDPSGEYIDLLKIYFDSNTDPGTKAFEEGEKITQEFKETIEGYLKEKGLAYPLPWWA